MARGIYQRELTTSTIDAIKTDSGANCFFCAYRHTTFAIVYGNKMLRLCGACARGLLKALPAIDKGDDR